MLALALRKMNNTQLSGDYAMRLYPHVDELGPQLRPPVYGLLSRFALEVGSVDEACGYLLKVPMQDRRPLTFSEAAKCCVQRKRPDLVVSLLDGSPSLSPELIGHTIASFARSGLYVQALAYESVLSEEMSVHNRTLSWGFPFLLLSAAHKGFEGAARRIMGDMTSKWSIVPSELDFNLALFAHMKAGLAGVAEGSNGFSEIFGLLYRMKTLGYGLHPILTDFDPFHPSIPPGFRDILCGVKMTTSLLRRVAQPSAEVSVAGRADGTGLGSASGLGSGSGASDMDRLLSSSLAITAERRGNLFPFPPLDSNYPPTASSSTSFSPSPSTSTSSGRVQVQVPDFTPSDLIKLAFDSDDVSAASSGSSREGSRDSAGELRTGDADADGDADHSETAYGVEDSGTYQQDTSIPGPTQDPDTDTGFDRVSGYLPPKPPAVSQSTLADERTRTRVWNPTNLKNLGTEPTLESAKKGMKKTASWPLRPNFMSAKEDDFGEGEEGESGSESGGDSEGESDDQSESEGESGYGSSVDEADMDSRDSEGEVLSSYFGEADWLLRKMASVNFSPAELSDMRLMDSLVLVPSTSDQQSSGADWYPRAAAGTVFQILLTFHDYCGGTVYFEFFSCACEISTLLLKI